MKGLILARNYYENVGKPMLERDFPQYLDEAAVGLVGEGSECFGFDDEISQDHDFGARFCIWLPAGVYKETGERMQQAYRALQEPFMGYAPIPEYGAGGAQRSGVFSIDDFYGNLLHQVPLPQKEIDWFAFQESALAAATNGEVFTDPKGIFTHIREKIQAYYPENVRLKKIARSLAYMAQTGQVNYARCKKRGDNFAARLCMGEFIKASLRILYLLNKRYMPFYKWAGRGLQDTEVLPQAISMLEELQSEKAETQIQVD